MLQSLRQEVLQIPACAETKNESSVQKETGEEIGVQMQQLKEESEPLTLPDLSWKVWKQQN